MSKEKENKEKENKEKEKSEPTKVRKYGDFFPKKSSIDKELLAIFFSEKGFQHDSLGLMPLTTSDTIKSALIYFKKNVLDVEKDMKNVKKNESISADQNKEKLNKSKINLE